MEHYPLACFLTNLLTGLCKMGWTTSEWFTEYENCVPGRQLVTAQCFTNALYVENENGDGEAEYQVHEVHINPYTPTQSTLR